MKINKALPIGLAAMVLSLGLPGGQQEMGASLAWAQEAEPVEGAPLGSVAVDASLRHFALEKKVFWREAWGDGGIAYTQYWAELHMPDRDGRKCLQVLADHEPLREAVGNYNLTAYQRAVETENRQRDEALAEMHKHRKGFLPHYVKQDIFVRRADSLAVSFVEAQDGYVGGTHRMYGYDGVTIDPATGARLTLSDVFRDKQQLALVLYKALVDKYGAELFYDADETVRKSVMEETQAWTLDPRGVTFYFPPYEAAPYASGLLTVTFLFDERPGLFQEKYHRGPAAYAETLLAGQDVEISLHDDPSGRHDVVRAEVADGKLQVFLNGQGCDVKVAVPEGEILPVHVHTEGGRNFLYVDSAAFGDEGRSVHIYDLDGMGAQYSHSVNKSLQKETLRESGIPHSITQWVLTNPDGFTVYDPIVPKWGEAKAHPVNATEDGHIAFG